MQMVNVADGVQLEVLDFGGTGRPIVLLAGFGNTAHVYDELAPKLTGAGHVYAVTRRGYGVSSRPQSGYDVSRLGEDVFAVIETLRLEKPVLVGHSMAGQELSYLASEHQDRIAGLVYLDAAYRYAYDVPGEFEKDFPSLPSSAFHAARGGSSAVYPSGGRTSAASWRDNGSGGNPCGRPPVHEDWTPGAGHLCQPARRGRGDAGPRVRSLR